MHQDALLRETKRDQDSVVLNGYFDNIPKYVGPPNRGTKTRLVQCLHWFARGNATIGSGTMPVCTNAVPGIERARGIYSHSAFVHVGIGISVALFYTARCDSLWLLFLTGLPASKHLGLARDNPSR